MRESVSERSKTHPQLRPIATVTQPRQPVGWPAWQLREGVATGRLRVVDIVDAHLERLDAVQPALNAAVTIRREAALREAEQLQSAVDAEQPVGVLCGVPFTVKDVIATAGTTTSCGSAAFLDNVPDTDAVAVRRLREAGAVLIAKTNCPEFAFGVTSDNVIHGVTRSPWGPHSPGGSSGGEAALVAAGASAVGIGTDYGGSLRWPGQCCGVLALRPGVGRVDGTGQLPEVGGRMDGTAPAAPDDLSVQRRFQVVGPIARTVRDLAITLAVISADPELLEIAIGQGPEQAAAALEGVSVGWMAFESSQRVGAGVQLVIAAAAAALADIGVAVEETPGVMDGLHDAFNELRATDRLADLRAAVGARRDLLGATARTILDSAPLSDADPVPLQGELARLRQRVARQLKRTPVLLLPVAATAACSLDGTAIVDGELLSGFELMAQCRAVTALGMPALSLPVGQDNGLPVSVQVVTGPGREDLALRVGLVLEQLLGGCQPPPWLPSVPAHPIPTTAKDSSWRT